MESQVNQSLSCTPEVEAMITDEQAERYSRLVKYQAEYWETGDGFGGRYFRDYKNNL